MLLFLPFQLKHKLSVKAPAKSLVENYLVEIAKSHNVAYDPDPAILDVSGSKTCIYVFFIS